MKSRLAVVAALAMAVAACTPAVDVASPEQVDPAILTAALTPFDSCEALLAHIKAEAQERVGPYGLGTDGYPWMWLEGDVAFETTAAAEELARGGDDSGGDASSAQSLQSDEFSGTNTQEANVDEPDIIKTDGRRILTISQNVLTYVDLAGDAPAARGSLRLEEGWSHELFFAGDRAFVITNGGTFGGPIPVDDFSESRIVPEFSQAAVIYEIDLSDPSDLSIAATLRLEGAYLSARAVGDTVRLAMSSPPNQLPFVYPANQNGEDRATEFNRDVIAESTIDDWLPRFSLDVAGTASEGRMIDCARVFRPADFAGFDVVSVLSLDLGTGLGIGSGTGVLASGQTVYASSDRFYVATTKWIEPDVTDESEITRWSENYTTQLHAFDNTGAEAEYVASGEVKGSLLNQFSLDETDGYLRLVTTDGSPWDESNVSETFLTVLEERGDALEQVGRVGGLGKGEALYSARILDDVAFAVTFRQVDPLYVIDLSDPTAPSVSGELKIPGFSTYLHPIGDDRLLGVGRDATEEGQVVGFKVSLFSVADPANPQELATWKLPDAESVAEYDHRAFQYLPDRGIAVLPIRTWNQDRINGAVLLDIGEASITEVGRVTHVAPGGEPTTTCTELTEDDFPSQNSELHYMTLEDYGRVQVCEPGDDRGYGSYYCDPVPLSELEGWGVPADERDALAERFAPESVIEVCWPNDDGWQEQIQRSLVVGDVLWTMSAGYLQGNLFDGLTEVGKVDIGG